MKPSPLPITLVLIAILCAGCFEDDGIGPDSCFPNPAPELNFKSVHSFCEGLAAVVPVGGSLYGFIDTSGAYVIPCAFSSASSFSEGLAPVRNADGLYGFIDAKGTLRIPYQYEYARRFSDGLAYVSDKAGSWFIDKSGTKMFGYVWYDQHDFKEGRAIVRMGFSSDKRYGFIGRSGSLVVPLIYTDADDFAGGLAPVANDSGKWGFIDRDGVVKVSFDYDYAEKFSEGMALVGRINKEKSSEYQRVYYDYGYIDSSGRLALPMQYSYAYSFSDGMAVASGRVIDKTGKVIYASSFGATYFVDGVGWTVSWCGSSAKNARKRYGFVSILGERLFPDFSVFPADISEGLIAVEIESGTNDGSPPRTRTAGFITKQGKLWVR